MMFERENTHENLLRTSQLINGYVYRTKIPPFSPHRRSRIQMFCQCLLGVAKLNIVECHNESMYDKINLTLMCNAI